MTPAPSDREATPVLSVGDRVAVIRHGAPVSIVRVVRVLKRYVECADGSKWGVPSGHEYPRQEWTRAHIERATTEHEATLQLRRAIRKIQAARWDSMPAELVHAVAAMLPVAPRMT